MHKLRSWLALASCLLFLPARAQTMACEVKQVRCKQLIAIGGAKGGLGTGDANGKMMAPTWRPSPNWRPGKSA